MTRGMVVIRALLTLLAFLLTPGARPAWASTPAPQPPPGFHLLSENTGVWLYRKNYPEGTPDYVQVIDMSQGATIKLLHSPKGEPRKGKGMFGGDDYRFQYRTLRDFWGQATAVYKKTFCVLNGLFFYMPENPTRLAMPLKVDGEIVTAGFGYTQYAGQELMLELWEDHARIRELSQSALYNSSAPDIIAGLSEEANKKSKYAVGRTFVALDDRDDDGSHETLLVLNTSSATQAHAAAVLRSFGANDVMMLDGGGSTQLLCRDGHYIQSERLIPQALAVIAGSGPPYQAVIVRYPDWPVIVVGQETQLEIELLNEGAKAWEPRTDQLMIKKSPWGAQEWLPLPQEIEPQDKAIIPWSTATFYRGGVYHVQAGMTHNNRPFPSEPVHFTLIVLPAHLEARQEELSKLVAQWLAQPETDVEARVLDWMRTEGEMNLPPPDGSPPTTAGVEINLNDAKWVPLLMFPFIAILTVVIFLQARRQA